tara:strand:+ start:1057 stop:2544 length:1488 start_codon:yes stop_codon:yes gene_type:complete
MDWKNKLKHTGIRVAKQELNKAKNKKVNKIDNSLVKNSVQQSTNRRSNSSRMIENLLETTAKDKARAEYSKPLGKVSDKLNSTVVGSILNNVVDVPGMVQDKLDSQVDRAIKSFKTPSTKSEKKKKIDELKKVESASDIGKGSKEIKQKIKDKQSNLLEDIEKRNIKNKLEEGVNGLIEVFQKTTKVKQKPLADIITDKALKYNTNLKNNPKAVKQKQNQETKVISNKIDSGTDPKLRFTVQNEESLNTDALKNFLELSGMGEYAEEGKKGIKNRSNTGAIGIGPKSYNDVSQQFEFPIQKNTLTESFSFSYEAGKKSLNSALNNLEVGDKQGGLLGVVQAVINATEKGRQIDDMLSKAGRQGNLAYNPNIEQIFQNVDIRAFNFEFLLIPKNKKMYDKYMENIQLLKYWSHPEQNIGSFLKYPRPWQIEYILPKAAGGVEKTIYAKEVYCTEISVQYAGGAEFLLNLEDDSFSAIELKIGFIEKEILLRDNFLR